MPDHRARVIDCQVRVVNDEKRVLGFTGVTQEKARDGDIILVDGMDTADFERNPVFLWSHMGTEPPLGRVTALKRRGRGKKRVLDFEVQFAGLEQLHDLAETVFLLYRDGFLHAVSVGWLTKKFKQVDDAERKKLGLDGFGRVHEETELLEFSAVSVPADPGAVASNSFTDEHREALHAVRSIAPEADQAALAEFERVLSDPPEEVSEEDMPEAETVGTDLVARLEELTERVTTIGANVEHIVSVTRDLRAEFRTRSEDTSARDLGSRLRSPNDAPKANVDYGFIADEITPPEKKETP